MQRQRVHAADRVRGAVEGRSQRPVRRHEEQDAVRQVFPNPALRHREVQVHQVTARIPAPANHKKYTITTVKPSGIANGVSRRCSTTAELRGRFGDPATVFHNTGGSLTFRNNAPAAKLCRSNSAREELAARGVNALETRPGQKR